MTSFLLEIITPEQISFQDQVDFVSVPSVNGVLGILPGHIPLFTQLTEGELKILKGKEETYISLGQGFMDITRAKVTILVTKALHADEIDEARLLQAQKEAEEALKNPPTPESTQISQAVLRSILVDLKVSQHRRHRQIPS
ncbi:MAG: ATP synthase F1 subunit epsilon [Candidatus Gottesmanbacteria bacterium]